MFGVGVLFAAAFLLLRWLPPSVAAWIGLALSWVAGLAAAWLVGTVIGGVWTTFIAFAVVAIAGMTFCYTAMAMRAQERGEIPADTIRLL